MIIDQPALFADTLDEPNRRGVRYSQVPSGVDEDSAIDRNISNAARFLRSIEMSAIISSNERGFERAVIFLFKEGTSLLLAVVVLELVQLGCKLLLGEHAGVGHSEPLGEPAIAFLGELVGRA